MPRKKLKKKPLKLKGSSRVYSRLKIFIFIAALIAIGIFGKSLLFHENYKVLGTTTYLASSGSGSDGDSGSNSGSGSSGGSDSDDSDDNSDSSGSGSSGTSSSENSGSSRTSSSGGSSNANDSSTKVLCTGPDGKKFETKRKDCEELNRAWNKPANFTTLHNKVKSQPVKTETHVKVVKPSSSVTPELEEEKEEDENENDDDKSIKTKTETKVDEEQTVVRLSETERIRTRTKDGRTRIDITSGGIKTRYEIRGDRVIIKAEQEDGTETELEDDTLLKIDDRLAKNNIKIATAGANKFLVQKGTTGAITDFPVSVDLATNTVYVTTPTGQRTITVLPEQAVQNLIALNIVSRLGGQAVVDVVTKNNVSTVDQLIALDSVNGIPVYQINGVSDQKLLGLFPVAIEKDITVSAETGNAVVINQSFGNKFLDAFSF